MAKKKTPVDASNLAGAAFTGVDEAENFGDRIARYAQAHSRSLSMLEHLRGVPGPVANKTAASLATCGNYLHFREYFTVGKVRLHNATFCKQHLVCPLCAIRRGAKALGAYLARWQVIQEEHPELRPYLLTLTVKNGDDLEERQGHLTASLKRLMHHRRDFNAGTRGAPWTELCKALGGVYTLELTNKGNGWHPHCHMIILAAQVLKGKRLLNSFGLFRGVQVPESLLDEPLDALPYWDRFYRFMGGEYRFTGESPKGADHG